MSSIYNALKRVQHDDINQTPQPAASRIWSSPKNWAIIIIAITLSSILSMSLFSYMTKQNAAADQRGGGQKQVSAPASINTGASKSTQETIQEQLPPIKKEQSPAIIAPERSKDEYIRLANLYFNKGDLEKAAATYKEALTVYKNDASLINNLGAVLLAKSDYDNAIEYFKVAIKCSKDNVEPVYNLACAYAKKGDRTSAIRELNKALKMNGQEVRKWAQSDPDLESLKGAWN